MDPITTLIFLVIASNAGGEGKTLLAALMKALWLLGDQPVQLICGDPGNRAAKVADESARTVGWGVQAMRASDIVASTAGQHVILDLGANTLASAREIVDLLPALRAGYASAGYRTMVLLPVSTNKTGAVEAIKVLASNLTEFEQLFVEVNRDGSGTYDKDLSAGNVIRVGHLQPGFQTYVREVVGSLNNAVTDPQVGYEHASAYIAKWMRTFASQEPVRDLVGDITALRTCNPVPGDPWFKVSRLSDATNEQLEWNVYRSKVLDAIVKTGWTAAGIREVAEMMDAGAF